ncbi:MAG: hypothetical protein IPG39_18835 [Bacteroidetes bacterium]|nr:hypothetical protein [Bacteroidota bacterium]
MKAIRNYKELNKDFESASRAIQGKAEALIKLKAYTPGINSLKETIFLKQFKSSWSTSITCRIACKYETEKKETEILKLNSDKKFNNYNWKSKSLIDRKHLSCQTKTTRD